MDVMIKIVETAPLVVILIAAAAHGNKICGGGLLLTMGVALTFAGAAGRIASVWHTFPDALMVEWIMHVGLMFLGARMLRARWDGVDRRARAADDRPVYMPSRFDRLQ